MGYTKGPWRVDVSEYGDELWFGGSGCGLIEVNGWYNGGTMKSRPDEWARMLDDANLIAAAPDLLEALEMLVNLRDGGMLSDYALCKDAIDVAKIAISRAKGEAE